MSSDVITGTTAAGVRFLVVTPSDPSTAPVVIAWHLMDAPRSEAAFAAQLPMAGLDAWKIYLGLPGFGARFGNEDDLMARLATDPPGLVHGPTHAQAADEFPDAWAELRERFGLAPDAAVGLVGGSMGAAIAAEVLARGTSGARTAVFVSPLLQLREMIDEVAPQFGGYEWTEAGIQAAQRLDYVARAGELGGAALRIIVGADDAPAMVSSARATADATGADLHVLEGMEHALADDPGVEPAPQTEVSRRVDPLVAEWLREHLR